MKNMLRYKYAGLARRVARKSTICIIANEIIVRPASFQGVLPQRKKL